MPADASRHSGRPRDRRLDECLAAASLLSRPRATVCTDDLCRYLDIGPERAQEILDLLATGTDASAVGAAQDETTEREAAEPILPLYASGDGRVTRHDLGGAGAQTALRLTERQADALDAAFDLVGIPRDATPRRTVTEAFRPFEQLRGEGATQGVQAAVSTDVGPRAPVDALVACARSMARARGEAGNGNLSRISQPLVTFTYQGDNDLMARTRRIVPRGLRVRSGAWVVDAFDVDARGVRTFLAERMRDTKLTEAFSSVPSGAAGEQEGTCVTLTCRGAARAAVQRWDGARIVEDRGHELVVEVPYYRGDWLPRHVMALLPLVTFDDPQLAAEIADIARGDLTLADELAGRDGPAS